MNNLITLCPSCNGKVNYDRLFWEQLFKIKIYEKNNEKINEGFGES
jgi:hypothetical protein